MVQCVINLLRVCCAVMFTIEYRLINKTFINNIINPTIPTRTYRYTFNRTIL